jgi:hypothetical protein
MIDWLAFGGASFSLQPGLHSPGLEFWDRIERTRIRARLQCVPKGADYQWGKDPHE